MAMVLFLNRGTFQAEDIHISDSHINEDTLVTFVDFIPGVVERTCSAAMSGGAVKYHSFRSLVDMANRWLQRNPEWRVFNCETVLLLYKYNDIKNCNELRPNDCCFYISGSERTNILKGLRIWIKLKQRTIQRHGSVLYQELNYTDLVPEIDEKGSFKKLDDLVERANILIRKEEIQGRIICVETVTYEADTDWKVDPDETLSALSTKKLFILRIFYEEGLPLQEEIDIIDFVPKHLSGGGFFKRPKFESYTQVMSRASQWLSQNRHLNYRNAQSIDIKLSIKSLTSVNTKTMYYTDYGSYIRIFRVCCTKSSRILDRSSATSNKIKSTIHLSSRLFLPVRKKDTIGAIRERFEEWIHNATQEAIESDTISEIKMIRRLRVLSAETICMFCKSYEESLEESIDEPFHYNRFGAKNDTIGTINGITIKPPSPIVNAIEKIYPNKTIGSQTCILM
uniref:Uncharacterized protein n=1 Tax=Tetranychus urticae TaxID=32264 RepID=T1KXM2_TETUR